MGPERNEREPSEPKGPVPNFEEALSNLTNAELLSALDLALLELEKRLYRAAVPLRPRRSGALGDGRRGVGVGR